MIDRLRTSLRALSALSPTALMSAEHERLRGDCADALRLELDCPQQQLTSAQRAELVRLSALLEDSSPPPDLLASALRDAWRVIA